MTMLILLCLISLRVRLVRLSPVVVCHVLELSCLKGLHHILLQVHAVICLPFICSNKHGCANMCSTLSFQFFRVSAYGEALSTFNYLPHADCSHQARKLTLILKIGRDFSVLGQAGCSALTKRYLCESFLSPKPWPVLLWLAAQRAMCEVRRQGGTGDLHWLLLLPSPW